MGKRKRKNYKPVPGYVQTLVFDGEAVDYTYLGRKRHFGSCEGSCYKEVNVVAQSDFEEGTPEWENDMIDNALDSFKGTDWSHVYSLSYKFEDDVYRSI